MAEDSKSRLKKKRKEQMGEKGNNRSELRGRVKERESPE